MAKGILAFSETFRRQWARIREILKELLPTGDLEKLLEYNVPHGKGLRGLAHVFACNELSSGHVSIETASAVGWAIEMIQASFLVADDIMDNSKTRRGNPCWYLLPEVGLSAVNDAVVLESSAFQLLRKILKDHPELSEILFLFQDTMFKTAWGQKLDTSLEQKGDISLFRMEKYKEVVDNKTSFYTIHLPVLSAIALCQVKLKPEVREKLDQILEDIGLLFQMQDDYLDVFGDPVVTGKIGTDIEDGKCTWLVVKALEIGGESGRQFLEDHYGNGIINAEKVKAFYLEKEIPKIFRNEEEAIWKRICTGMNEIPDKRLVTILNAIVTVLYRRGA